MSTKLPPLVELQGIRKAWPGCVANDDIDLALHAGQIHALLGENGAGKSTLVKVLYGLVKPDAGSIHWRGQRVTISDPARARELGIAMVFQHFSLFESLSVLENIALGLGLGADLALAERIRSTSSDYGLALDPDRAVHSLSVGERQRIEIVRCLLQSPALLVMDEPTSVLTPQEATDLFTTLRRLRDEGMAILYISHKLEEIRSLCDDATILRKGRVVARTDPARESAAGLAAQMMGADVDVIEAAEQGPTGVSLLQVQGLSAQDDYQSLQDIHIELFAGEIVGIAGVAGNGQDLLLDVLSGEHRTARADAVRLAGQGVGQLGPAARRRRGLASVPEQRLGHAAVPDMSLMDNVLLNGVALRHLHTWGVLRPRQARALTRNIIEQFDVRASGPEALASSLSGGNLQKFIVGRAIVQCPSVLIVAQPTWGVDAGAAVTIHRALRKLAADGAAVLLISQDLDELMALSHRMAALCAGRLSAFHPTHRLDASDVGVLMGGQALERAS